ncbi:MAG: DUF4433 domain-containing protein [Methylococcales bacterium]
MANKQIFHITHVNNLSGIIGMNNLWCDIQRISEGIGNTNIGYSHIKKRRMARPVTVSEGGTLGNYVPFNFCPRSVMLYVVSRGHENYEDGQDSIIHLVSSIDSIVASGRSWAFTDRHADLGYANQYDSLDDLYNVDWGVMPERYWADSEIKEKRQAEFLVHDYCPWTVIEEIAVINQSVKDKVEAALVSATHKPAVQIRRNWYY